MLTLCNELTALLAEIDQKIVAAYEEGKDGSLKMRELFEVYNTIDHLKESRERAEEALRASDQ